MAVMVPDRISAQSAPVGVQDLREEALKYFIYGNHPEDLHVQAGRPERSVSVTHDPFDDARIIAFHGDEQGDLEPSVRRHLDIQRATRITESLGSFDNQVEVPLIEGWLVSFGERETRTRARAVMAALALEDDDSGFRPYVWRTLYENLHKAKEHDMVRAETVPVGTAMIIISPCEPGVYGKRLGMFPEREMAVMQISWKHSADAMRLRCVSLDRASLKIISEMLAENGVKVPADALPEDYLAHVLTARFNSQEEQDQFVRRFVKRFDELVLRDNPDLKEAPRQGVVGYDARNVHSSVETITDTEHGCLALQQIHKLDTRLAKNAIEPQPLDPEVRLLAAECANGRRSDGSSLLRPYEQAAIRQLLTAEKVFLEDPDQAAVMKLVIEVHSSAVEESLRDFMAGDQRAMDWMKTTALTNGRIIDIVSKGTVAIENGRGANGCGRGGEITSGLPDHKLYPNAYMLAKYGPGAVEWGTCGGCGNFRLVAKCAPPRLCGTCDGEKSRRQRR